MALQKITIGNFRAAHLNSGLFEQLDELLYLVAHQAWQAHHVDYQGLEIVLLFGFFSGLMTFGGT